MNTEYITYLTGDLTGYYLLGGFGVLLFMGVVVAVVSTLVMPIYNTLKARTWYDKSVYAYKTGMIYKRAEETKTKMVYEPTNKKSFIEKIENDTFNDIENKV